MIFVELTLETYFLLGVDMDALLDLAKRSLT